MLLFLFGRAFHHYREVRDQKEALKKHPELERLLKEEYRSLDDFRAKEKEKTAREGSSSNHSGSYDGKMPFLVAAENRSKLVGKT